MVDAVENVPETRAHEPGGGLMPPWVEADDARIVVQLEGAVASVRCQQPQCDRDALREGPKPGIDGEPRPIGCNRIFEPGVEEPLLPVQLRVVREPWSRDVSERRAVLLERSIRRQRDAHGDERWIAEPLVLLVHRHFTGDPDGRSRAQRLVGAREIDVAGAALRDLDIAQGLQRHAHEKTESVPFRLEERLDDDGVRNVVRESRGPLLRERARARSPPQPALAWTSPSHKSQVTVTNHNGTYHEAQECLRF